MAKAQDYSAKLESSVTELKSHADVTTQKIDELKSEMKEKVIQSLVL